MLNKWLLEQAAILNIELTSTALLQLDQYAQLLQAWNQKINLTTITATPEIYEQHFLDSLSATLIVDMEQVHSLIDVGTGAGFPGLVLAIVFPTVQVTLLESINKKARFLKTVVEEVGLSERVSIVCERAETVGQQAAFREQFDVAIARAVARLVVLAEYCMPLVRIGGCFVAQKGPQVEAELAEAGRALKVLGGDTPRYCQWSLPSGPGRALVRTDKVQPSPGRYPRRPGTPNKRPLL